MNSATEYIDLAVRQIEHKMSTLPPFSEEVQYLLSEKLELIKIKDRLSKRYRKVA